MHRQVGDLELDQRGLARRGLLVRHLILPEDLSGTAGVLKFLSEEISPNTYLNLMDQYRPAFKAGQFPPLDRRITKGEYHDAIRMAEAMGLTRLDQRRAWW
jgi:putative pyruvate formate lyase activating enzyme